LKKAKKQSKNDSPVSQIPAILDSLASQMKAGWLEV